MNTFLAAIAFPIAVWWQAPLSTHTTLGPNLAAAAKTEGINIFLGISGAAGGPVSWPERFGADNGQIEALKANGLYLIGGINTPTTENTSAQSVASMLTLAAATGSEATLIGYSLCDEPTPAQMPSVPGWVATLHGYDPTRPAYCNQVAWMNSPEYYHDVPARTAALQAAAVASFDLYPVTNPYLPKPNGDQLWRQGVTVQATAHFARPSQPVWVYVETGSDELGFSGHNGTCTPATNLCAQGNEYRATPSQVAAEAWMSVINGATGIEWFCHDKISYSFCLGDTKADPQAGIVAANLTYIDATLTSFAEMINAPTVGACSMISENYTTGAYTTATSCASGGLAVQTVSGPPGSALLKSVSGAAGSALYLIAQPAKRGAWTATFSVTGKTATVVYDSAARYNPPHSTAGQTIAVSGWTFTDTFADDYETRIYKFTSPSPNGADNARP